MGAAEDLRDPGLELERGARRPQRPLGLEQPVRPARHGRRIDRRQHLFLGARVVQQPAHDPVDPLQLARHAGDHFAIRAPPSQYLDVGAERPQGVPHLVGDTRGETPDARELLRAHQLALGVEQVVGHAVETFGEGGEVAGLGIGRAPRQVAVRHRVRGGHDAGERPEHEPLHERPTEHDEHPHLEADQEQQQDEGALRGQHGHHHHRRHTDQQRGGRQEREIKQ